MFDPVSLCVLEVPAPAFDYLKSLQRWMLGAVPGTPLPAEPRHENAKAEVRETLADLAALADAGLLGAPDPGPGAADEGLELGYVVLQLAHACNLSCTYCFADGGDYGGTPALMSPAMARQAIEFVWPHFGTNDIHIGFFGGEPLLNVPVLRDVVEEVEARAVREGRACRFSITTNATRITPAIREFLDVHGFNVIVSHDGAPEQHNALRILNNGEGSFEQVARGLAQLRGSPVAARTTLRATFTRAETAVEERAAFLNTMIADGVASGCSVETVCMTSEGCGSDAAALQLTAEDLPRVKAEYAAVADAYVASWRAGFPYHLFHFDRLLRTLATRTAVVRSCSAGQHYVTVDPAGRIFACHKEGHSQIGSIQTGFDPRRRASWLANTLFDRHHCRECWARYQCGGGCRFHHEVVNGDPNEPWIVECELERHFVELAIWIMAELPAEAIREIVGAPPTANQ